MLNRNPKIIDYYKRGESPVSEPGLDKLIKNAVKDKKLVATNNFAAIKKVDVILLTVGTPLSEAGTADLSAIKDSISAMGPHLKDNQLIIIKSTFKF